MRLTEGRSRYFRIVEAGQRHAPDDLVLTVATIIGPILITNSRRHPGVQSMGLDPRGCLTDIITNLQARLPVHDIN